MCRVETWDQHKCSEKKRNPADMMTNAVGSEAPQQHLKFMNDRSAVGRAEKASKLVNSVDLNISVVGGGQKVACWTKMTPLRA